MGADLASTARKRRSVGGYQPLHHHNSPSPSSSSSPAATMAPAQRAVECGDSDEEMDEMAAFFAGFSPLPATRQLSGARLVLSTAASHADSNLLSRLDRLSCRRSPLGPSQ